MTPSDPRMRGFRERAEVSDVEAMLRARTTPLPPETIPLVDGPGRVLDGAVVAPCSVPGFHRSAMDGYALRGEETFGATEYTPLEFRIVGTSLPGRGFAERVGKGQAVRIMTGAPLPEGADAVLMAERGETRANGDEEILAVRAPVAPGKHVSRIGEDIAAGTEVLPAGRRLRPQDLGVLSSLGCGEVSVISRPGVTLLATGDELLPPGDPPRGYRIADANTPMLTALIERDGGTVLAAMQVADSREALETALADGTGDIIVVTGGTSVGQEDHVPTAVAALGELPVHGIAMRPSSPTGIGFIADRPVFLLPGNPVSCLCAYEFFAGPVLRQLGGLPWSWPHPQVELPLGRKLTSETGRVDYARVRVVNGRVEPLMVSGASILSSTTRADGVVIVPRDDEGLPAGQMVTVYLYG